MNKNIKIYNSKQRLLELSRKYIYLINPLIGIFAFKTLNKINVINISSTQNFLDNIINLSGIMAGFLFTTYGILMSLPNNKFIELLKFNKTINIVFKTLLLGIIFLISAMILGLFTEYFSLITYIFIFGISETVTSVYQFYQILKYSYKSS